MYSPTAVNVYGALSGAGTGPSGESISQFGLVDLTLCTWVVPANDQRTESPGWMSTVGLSQVSVSSPVTTTS